MDFEFSAEQEALRDAVRRFLADKAPVQPYVRGLLGDPRGTTDEVWSGLAALGATGLLVPEAHGGAGMGMVDLGVVLEEMGRVVHPGPFLSSAVGAVSLVSLAGGDEDRARWLPGLASGEIIGVPAILEPGHRGSWRHPQTRAEAAADGWLLHGVKAPVFDGAAADVLLVTAVAEGELGVWAVDRDAPGVGVEPTSRVDGTRPSATVTFDGAPGRRLSGDRDVPGAVGAAVDRILVAWVTDGVGAATVALEVAVAYAKERVQFGQPIGAFQAVQHLCTEMLQYVELARAGAYYALWAADAAPPAERRRAAAMAKAYASDMLVRVGAGMIQVLAGIGFTWEHDAHLYYKRLLTLQEAWGGAAEHLEELATLVV